MYRSLLVPLDRSPLAEQALPLALAIARRANARLDLVEVHAHYDLDKLRTGWAPFDNPVDAERMRQERNYLDATAARLASAPVAITHSVLPGTNLLAEFVADGLLERAAASGTDLIVMATRARGFLDRLGFGSVADELFRRADVPVLILPPAEAAPPFTPEPTVDEILIPLDGSALAEKVFGPALRLARLMEARCRLLRVASGLPEVAKAEGYLNEVAARLTAEGLSVSAHVLVARHPAEAILEEAAAQPNSLIALATHGRAGLNRLLLGSVANKLVRAAASPLLTYRPTGKGF
jgi:nucleotide-binding universal stress UspA family protein